jgi:hypothetical protein
MEETGILGEKDAHTTPLFLVHWGPGVLGEMMDAKPSTFFQRFLLV